MSGQAHWKEYVKLPVQDRLGLLEARVKDLEEELLKQREENNLLRRRVNMIIEAGGVNVF
jgi:hypothetical protein